MISVTITAIILMWLNGIYWLRVFTSTIIYIRLVIQTVKEMVGFLLIFFLILTMFGNVVFILNQNRSRDR